MRLVDADALPIVTQGKNHHRKYVFADITDPPTIDAVPVEWLDWRIMNAMYNGNKEAADAFEFVLNCWKEEQEAR